MGFDVEAARRVLEAADWDLEKVAGASARARDRHAELCMPKEMGSSQSQATQTLHHKLACKTGPLY